MVFINETETLGVIIDSMNQNTGSLFLTLFGFVVVILFICMLFRIPMLFSAIIVLPVLLVCMAYLSEFVTVGGVMLIYLGIMVGKHFFFNE